MTTVKEYLYGDRLLSLIRYAADNELLLKYIYTEDGEYTDTFKLIESLAESLAESVSGLVLQEEVQNITPNLVIPEDGEFDVKYRLIFSYIMVMSADIPDSDFNTFVTDTFNEFRDTLAVGLEIEGFWLYYNEFDITKIAILNRDINNSFTMLTNGFQSEWRDRLLELGESADPQEVQDYRDKFGQDYTEDVNGEWYNDMDNLPKYSVNSYSSAVYTAPSELRSQAFEGGIETGYRIFNTTQVNQEFPLLVYTINEDEKYYKILDGFVVTEEINNMLLKPFENLSEILDRGDRLITKTTGRGRAKRIEKVVTSHNDENTIQYIYRYQDSFINVILYLNTMSVEISLYSGELTEDIPGLLRIQDIRPMNISGKFNIYGDHLPPFVAEDIMLTNSVLNRMFDLHETTNVSIEYDRLSNIYRYPYQEDLVRVGLLNRLPTIVRFHVDNSYVVTAETDNHGNPVPIGTAKTIIQFNGVDDLDLLNRFIVFMRLFSAYSSNAQYGIFDEYYTAVGESYPAYTRITTLANKSVLQASRPDIFIDGYSTVCQTTRQPTIIDEEQYNSLTEEQKETTIKFPYTEDPDEIQLILMCPEDNPYPTLLNNRLDNKSSFPVLPCCQKSNTAVRKRRISYYNEFGQRMPRDHTTDIVLRTVKVLSPGTESEITRTNAIGIYKRLGYEDGTILKVGIDQTESFLNSCSYLLGETITRQDLLEDRWNNSLVSQECYDDDNPRNTIDTGGKIDSRYYRIIEEMFQINLFILRLEKNNIEFSNARHIPPYVRAYRQRDNIFILETPQEDGPAYEPIVYAPRELDKELVSIIPKDKTSIIYDLYSSTVGIYEMDSPYITVDLPTGGLGQFIDSSGKMRGIVYPELSIVTDLMQPLDLPASRQHKRLQNKEDLPNRLSPVYTVEYTSYSRNPYGLWFNLTREDTVIKGFTLASQRITTTKTEIFKSIPIINPTPNFESIPWTYDYAASVSELNILLDIMYYVYYRMGDIIYVGNDPNFRYDIKNIPQTITEEYQDNLLVNLARDSNVVQEIDGEYRLFLYTQKFADGMMYQLRTLRDRNYVPKSRLHRPPIDRNIGTIIVEGDKNYTKYIDYTTYSEEQRDVIPLTYNNIFPYIYKVNDLLFLIQPISSKDGLGEKRATYVAHEWRRTGENHGYLPDWRSEVEDYDSVETVIYLNQIFNIYADYFIYNGKYYSILPLHSIDENVFADLRQSLTSPEEVPISSTRAIRTTRTRARMIGTRGGTRIRTTRRSRGRPRLETRVVWQPT